MRFGRTIAFFVVLWLALTTGWANAGDDTGTKIGAKAAGFTLKDQNGQERSLDELLKKGNVALVFFRSASW
jgi:cytochrome oxidase Cu insertion factor (SCO1/SenC/PrrC family)